MENNNHEQVNKSIDKIDLLMQFNNSFNYDELLECKELLVNIRNKNDGKNSDKRAKNTTSKGV